MRKGLGGTGLNPQPRRKWQDNNIQPSRWPSQPRRRLGQILYLPELTTGSSPLQPEPGNRLPRLLSNRSTLRINLSVFLRRDFDLSINQADIDICNARLAL